MLDAPRLDHSLVISKSGLISASEKGKITQNATILNPDVKAIKPTAPEYSFSKNKRGESSSKDKENPGAIYDVPGSIGDFDPRKGVTFPKSSKEHSSHDGIHHLTDHATVLSLEQATIVDQVTKRVSPKYSIGNKNYYEGITICKNIKVLSMGNRRNLLISFMYSFHEK